MNILIIAASDLPIPAYKGGATETLVTELLSREKIKNGSFHIKVYSHCKGKTFVDGNVEYCFLEKTLIQKIKFIFYLVVRLLSGRKRNIPDFFPDQIAHYENLDNYDLIILEGNKDQVFSLRKNYKGIIALHIHTVMTLMKDTYKAKKVVNKCDYLLANSTFAKRKMNEIDDSLDTKIIEWKNCINTEIYMNKKDNNRKEMREQFSISDGEFTCVFCGRLEPGKGVLELIRAFKLLNIPRKLIIVGASWFSSTHATKYIRLLKKESEEIKEKIIFTGYVKHSEVRKYYKMADISVMPSIYEESAGLVALESQASGLPTIVSNIGGIPEFIHQKSSLKVDINHEFSKNIAELIQRLYSDKCFYDSEKQLALSSAARFDISRYENEFINIMKKICAEKSI